MSPETTADWWSEAKKAELAREREEGRDHLGRTGKDYAIEFGGYLATAADRFMAEVNRSQEAGEPIDGDIWSGLQSAIYEFRKRAERAKA